MSDVDFMRHAIELGRGAAADGEVPVGALIARAGQLLAVGANRPVREHDPTAHAEIVAMRRAALLGRNYRLEGATLYVTLEPCAMCIGAAVNARLARVVFGAWDAKAGACGSVFDLTREPRIAHKIDVFGGVLAGECADMLRHFFAAKR